MIWLTWRQFRGAAAMMAAALAALAAMLALTGPGLADDYASGIAACTQSGGCLNFVDQFFIDHQGSFLAVTAVVLVLPALIGLFWGAPLLTPANASRTRSRPASPASSSHRGPRREPPRITNRAEAVAARMHVACITAHAHHGSGRSRSFVPRSPPALPTGRFSSGACWRAGWHL
jgi:hypothetical protein